MRIDADARLAETDSDHEIGGLPAHAGQLDQGVDIVRHNAAVLIHEDPADPQDVACLRGMKPHGINGPVHVVFGKIQHGGRIRGQREQALTGRRGRLVLRPETEHGADQNAEWIVPGLLGHQRQCRFGPRGGLVFQDRDHPVDILVFHPAGSLPLDGASQGEKRR